MDSDMVQSFDDPSNLYRILGVPRNADDEMIKKAYRKLALKHHPDRHHGVDSSNHMEKFQHINTAHKILSDKGKRRIYDAYGMKGIQFLDGQNAENLPNFIFKKWFKPVFYIIFLFSCCGCFCCCGCLCCCGFCCNFCCGKYAPKDPMGEDNDYDFERNDEENATQRETVSETISVNETNTVDKTSNNERNSSTKV